MRKHWNGIGAAAAAFATACGGGGGSSSVNAGPPLVYVGNVSPAILSSANASKLIVDVIGSDDSVSMLDVGSDDAGSDDGGSAVDRGGRGIADLARRLGRAVPRRELLANLEGAEDRAHSLSIPIDSTELFGDGFVHVFGKLANNGTGVLAVIYSHCTLGDQTLDGRATLRIDSFDFGRLEPVDFTESFTHLSFVAPGFDGAVGGAVHFQLDLATNGETLTTDLVTLDAATGAMTKSEALVLEDTHGDAYFPLSYTEEMHGRVFDSVHGFVDITTSAPLGFESDEQTYSNPGALVLAGDLNQKLRVTVTSATQISPELDLDGDGIFESWTTILWSELSGGAEIDFVRPTAPDLTATVNSDGSVTLDWTASTDANGIREYRVFRGTTPIARTSGTTFTDRGAEPGRVVDERVRAVDNHGNLSDLLAPQTVVIPSKGSAAFDPPITGDLTFEPNSTDVGIAVADVNGDGSRDLIVTGGNNWDVETALGPLAAGVSFSSSTVFFPTLQEEGNLPRFLPADVVGDELPELLGLMTSLTWDRAASSWTVVAGTEHAAPLGPDAYLDWNDDGILDRISVNSASPPVLVGKLGAPDGTYDDSSIRNLAGFETFTWTHVDKVVAADFDRDGRTDLLVWDGDQIRIARQASRGTFELTAALAAIDNRGNWLPLLVADVTGDGFPDILYGDYSGTTAHLRVYVNDGTGHFPTTPVASGITDLWYFRAGDLDGDQIEDLAVIAQSDNLDTYHSNGDGTFTFLSSIDTAGFPNLDVADVDQDGDLDLVLAGNSFDAGVDVYLNQ